MREQQLQHKCVIIWNLLLIFTQNNITLVYILVVLTILLILYIYHKKTRKHQIVFLGTYEQKGIVQKN